MPNIMVARESYATEVNGERHSIVKGITRADADHPVVKQNPDYWEPLDKTVHLRVPRRSSRVEQATRAPGEQRGDDAARAPTTRAKSGR